MPLIFADFVAVVYRKAPGPEIEDRLDEALVLKVLSGEEPGYAITWVFGGRHYWVSETKGVETVHAETSKAKIAPKKSSFEIPEDKHKLVVRSLAGQMDAEIDAEAANKRVKMG